jgi:hypothetical protein
MFSYNLIQDGEEYDIVLRPFGEMPGRISRLHRGDIEAQMWEALSEIMEMLTAWQEDSGTDMGKSQPSSTTSAKPRSATRSKRT